jgi:hypothetical protein
MGVDMAPLDECPDVEVRGREQAWVAGRAIAILALLSGACESSGKQASDFVPGPDVVDNTCKALPPESSCRDGRLFDCSEEGFCNAVDCEDDGNPCTLEVFDVGSGGCARVVNEACREPLHNMIRVFRGAAAYYATWDCSGTDKKCRARIPTLGKQISMVQDLCPPAGTCCAAGGGPDKDGDGFCDPDHERFRSAVWRLLGFRLDGAHRYSYGFSESGSGAWDEEIFSIHAVADLDCDGKPGEWVLRGSFKADPSAAEPDYLVIAEPLEFEYLPEKGDGVWTVPAGWAAERFWQRSQWEVLMDGSSIDSVQLSVAGAFEPRLEESFFSALDEPIRELARMHGAAVQYYRIPKAEVGAPACQLAAPGLVQKYAKHLPEYQPLDEGPTPVEQNCCRALGGWDSEGDNLCDRYPEEWLGGWTAVGFAVLFPHAWWYWLKEFAPGSVPGAGSDAFGFEARATTAVDCASWEVQEVRLLQTLSPVDGTCTVSNPGSPGQGLPDFEFFPMGEEGSVVLPVGSGWMKLLVGNAGWQGVGGYKEVMPNHDWDVVLYEPLSSLDAMARGISDFWMEHCSLPALPDWTPTQDNCCMGYGDPELKQECLGDDKSWQHEFWTAIGFRMSFPHHYVYRVETEAMDGGEQLVTLKAQGRLGCTGFGGWLWRFGVASSGPNGCSVSWIPGYAEGYLFQ